MLVAVRDLAAQVVERRRRRGRGAEDHVAVEDVAGEDLLDLAAAEVDELDRDAEPADRGGGRVAVGVGRDVARDVDGDLRLGGRLGPAADRELAAGLAQRRGR